MSQTIAFVTLLQSIQEYISQNYAAALSDNSKFPQLRPYIEKYLRDKSYTVDGLSHNELTDKLYREMAEYSVLTKYLRRD